MGWGWTTERISEWVAWIPTILYFALMAGLVAFGAMVARKKWLHSLAERKEIEARARAKERVPTTDRGLSSTWPCPQCGRGQKASWDWEREMYVCPKCKFTFR